MSRDEPLHRLLQAVVRGDEESVRELGQRVGVCHAPDGHCLPLSVAIDNQSVRMAELLLELGADINAEDPHDRWTPLLREIDILRDVAGSTGRAPDLKMVKWLIEYGADPERPNSAGLTPRKAATAPELLSVGCRPLG